MHPLRRQRALTLFEVVIAIALMGLLLGTLLTFFWQTLTYRDQLSHDADRTQIVQQVLGRMAGELRSAVAFEDVGFPVQQCVGDRRSITFLMAPLPEDDSYRFVETGANAPVFKHDLREITYELWVDPEKETEDGEPLVAGILRTERQAINPLIPEAEAPEDEVVDYVRRDLWAPELGYLEFRYFDGAEWVPRWEVSQGNKLPHLIQITVGFDSLKQTDLEDKDLDEYPISEYPLGPDQPQLDRFSLIVKLPAADQMFSARVYRLAGETEEVYTTGETADDGDANEENNP